MFAHRFVPTTWRRDVVLISLTSVHPVSSITGEDDLSSYVL